MTATGFERALQENAQEWFSGRKTYETFHKDAMAIWDRIEQANLAEPVLKMVRAKIDRVQP